MSTFVGYLMLNRNYAILLILKGIREFKPFARVYVQNEISSAIGDRTPKIG